MAISCLIPHWYTFDTNFLKSILVLLENVSFSLCSYRDSFHLMLLDLFNEVFIIEKESSSTALLALAHWL